MDMWISLIIKRKGRKEEQEQQAIFAQEEAQEKARLIKKYGKRNAQLILDEKVEIGFTKQMCIEVWGEPQDINRTITRNRVHEQRVYGIGCYLYFEGNYLTAIQIRLLILINMQNPVYQRIYRLLTFVDYQKNEFQFSAQNIYIGKPHHKTHPPCYFFRFHLNGNGFCITYILDVTQYGYICIIILRYNILLH